MWMARRNSFAPDQQEAEKTKLQKNKRRSSNTSSNRRWRAPRLPSFVVGVQRWERRPWSLDSIPYSLGDKDAPWLANTCCPNPQPPLPNALLRNKSSVIYRDESLLHSYPPTFTSSACITLSISFSQLRTQTHTHTHTHTHTKHKTQGWPDMRVWSIIPCSLISTFAGEKKQAHESKSSWYRTFKTFTYWTAAINWRKIHRTLSSPIPALVSQIFLSTWEKR